MMPRLAEVKQQQAAEDIYAAVDLTHFRFTTRVNPFDWRLLHGIDVDEVVSGPALVRLPVQLNANNAGLVLEAAD